MNDAAYMTIRLLWPAAHLLALMVCDVADIRYRGWIAYLVASCALAAWYVPELDGWSESFAPWLFLVLALRITASVEALHYQIRDTPHWSRFSAGAAVAAVALVAAAMVALPTWLPDRSRLGQVVQFRRYAQIWIAAASVIVPFVLVLQGWWRAGREDWHQLIVAAIAVNHGVVSLLLLDGTRLAHAEACGERCLELYWAQVNGVSMAVNTLLLLVWCAAMVLLAGVPARRGVPLFGGLEYD